ncbi:hypothetical protein TUM4249_10430 [Shewanella sp. KT0246]|nr:hypothetical protein TUM4249_10430 [Shewanella sp. KT0246]
MLCSLKKILVKTWMAYIRWCDQMGFTLENKRSCAPRLEEPELNLLNSRKVDSIKSSVNKSRPEND